MRLKIVALTLLLAGCNDNGFKSEFTDGQRDEIRDIAGDVAAAPDDVEELQQQLEEANQAISDLRSRQENLSSAVADLEDQVASMEAAMVRRQY